MICFMKRVFYWQSTQILLNYKLSLLMMKKEESPAIASSASGNSIFLDISYVTLCSGGIQV